MRHFCKINWRHETCAILVVSLLWFGVFDFYSYGAQTPAIATIKISHTPVNYFVPGFRIKLKAQVTDPSGILLVRCYFRAKGEADFVFVEMLPASGNEYIGVLPAPSSNTVAIEYILLAVNFNKVVVRSQVFMISKVEEKVLPEWQKVDLSGKITVKTELAEAPKMIPGFTDSVAMDIVESAFRFGYVVEGIYILSQMAGAVPVGAVSGGTVAATSMGTAGTATASGAAEAAKSPSAIGTAAKAATIAKATISPVLIVIGVIGAAAAIVGGYFIIKALTKSKNTSTTTTTTTTIPKTTTTTTTTTIPGKTYTTIFSDDFESGSLRSGWNTSRFGAAVSVTSENKKNGSYSLKFYDTTSSNSPGVDLYLSTNSSRIGFECYDWTNDIGWNGGTVYLLESTPPDSTTGWVFCFGAQAYTNSYWKYISIQDKARWQSQNPWISYSTNFPTPVVGQTSSWHKVRVEIYGPEGKAKFWYDDQYKGEISITPTSSPLKYFMHAISWSSPTGTLNYIDDFKFFEISQY